MSKAPTSLQRLQDVRKAFNRYAEYLPGGPRKFKLLEQDSVSETPSGDYMIGQKHQLFRIQALVDIPAHGVKAGDLGGYIERERCLSHRGDCWIGGEARAFGQTRVRDDALVTDNARLQQRAVVEENAKVGGYSRVTQWSSVGGAAEVRGHSNLSWHSRAEGSAKLQDAKLLMNTRVESGTLTGEQPLSEADQKDLAHRVATDPVYQRMNKGLIGGSRP
ncbi:MAG: hypothetical protein ACK4PK_01000 [Alphaproteobacteria bacterium]